MTASRPSTETSLAKILATWLALNEKLLSLSETDVARLLQLERIGKNRRSFLLRIHQRYDRLRRIRERKAMRSVAPPQRRGTKHETTHGH